MVVRDSKRDAAKSVPAPAGYMRLLLRQFGTTPELRKALMAGVDIDEAALAKPGAEATLYSFIAFSANMHRIVGEDWPMQALAVWGTATQGALEVAVRSAATVGEGMEILARYGHVRGPFLSLRLTRDKTKTTLFISSGVPLAEAVFHAMSQTAAMSAKSMLDPVLEEARDSVVYQFVGKVPEHADHLRAVLGGTVRFNQRHYAIVITNAVCAKESPYADQDLLATALAELEQAAQRIRGEDTLTLRVERLMKRKRTGRLSEDDAARELGLSRRTLVRRLAASGTSYRALLDANLKQRARQLLDADKHTRADMAEMLGFEDPTSFSRACRRWFKAER